MNKTSDNTDTYKTISKTSQGYFKDRGSKFLSFAYPVKTEKEIKTLQKELRKKYYDARHHCYAFRLGADKKIYRASDDGEPANSSGPPILGQIQSKDLTDILIIVIRYFGGTKLGIPGLIHAYRTAALEAINNTKIITKAIMEVFELQFAYTNMNKVMRIIKEANVEQYDQNFELDCTLKIKIRKNKTDNIIEKLTLIEGLSVSHIRTN